MEVSTALLLLPMNTGVTRSQKSAFTLLVWPVRNRSNLQRQKQARSGRRAPWHSPGRALHAAGFQSHGSEPRLGRQI